MQSKCTRVGEQTFQFISESDWDVEFHRASILVTDLQGVRIVKLSCSVKVKFFKDQDE